MPQRFDFGLNPPHCRHQLPEYQQRRLSVCIVFWELLCL